MSRKPILLTTLGIALLFATAWLVWRFFPAQHAQNTAFDGERAYRDVQYQVSLGPRTPGSPGHAQQVEWMVAELQRAGWQTEVQEGEQAGQPVRNVIATRGALDPEAEWVVLGAHFDTRFFADQDPDLARRQDPVPGANDGASGTAVLLELARILPEDMERQVWLVFFDAEDNGNIPGWDWILGSTFFVQQLARQPDAAVIVDMIGDADLNIYLELNSDPRLSAAIWAQAAALGYGEAFIPTPKYRILDDHIPFRNAGIPAVVIIDFDYPYWHTVADTADKVSASSLKIVGDTVLAWLTQP